MDFNFSIGVLGVSLSWLAFIPSNFSLTSTSAIYSIDGQTPINFLVPALSAANSRQLYNQVLFKTETLSPGQHKLVVTYQGNSGTAPLALDTLIIQNATSSSATSALTTIPGATSATSSTVPSNPTSNLDSRKSPLVGIIVGIVGGVIVLVLLLLLLLYNRRRNNRRAQKLKLEENSNLEPFTLSPQNLNYYNYTSEVHRSQVLSTTTPPSQPFSSKFSQSREPAASDAAPQAGTSIPPTIPPPVIGERINPISNPMTRIRNTETVMPLIQQQPSPSAQGGDLGVLQHADSGVRMQPAHAQLEDAQFEGNFIELPPTYTIG